jgi:drug/metabolite transporter (DMT)-like permease
VPVVSSIDLLLLFMTLIWGSNYTIVKSAFEEMPAQPFNAVRMVIASSLFLAAIAVARRVRRPSVFYTAAAITRRDWMALAGLAVVGHCLYQLCFIGGLARTSVANSSLILAVTPVAVMVLNALRGEERIGSWHWGGAALSIVGIYFIVGRGAAVGAQSLRGDLLMLGAVVCWAVYTVGAARLMARHSPLGVTGLSMTLGTMLYVPLILPQMRVTDWAAVSTGTWVALVYSSIFALGVAYMIWYTAVQKIGGTHTALYSNLVPLVALAVAVVWLREPLDLPKIAGAALVLAGVAITRSAARIKEAPAQE